MLNVFVLLVDVLDVFVLLVEVLVAEVLIMAGARRGACRCAGSSSSCA